MANTKYWRYCCGNILYIGRTQISCSFIKDARWSNHQHEYVWCKTFYKCLEACEKHTNMGQSLKTWWMPPISFGNSALILSILCIAYLHFLMRTGIPVLYVHILTLFPHLQYYLFVYYYYYYTYSYYYLFIYLFESGLYSHS